MLIKLRGRASGMSSRVCSVFVKLAMLATPSDSYPH
jgi:hypothetical protein